MSKIEHLIPKIDPMGIEKIEVIRKGMPAITIDYNDLLYNLHEAGYIKYSVGTNIVWQDTTGELIGPPIILSKFDSIEEIYNNHLDFVYDLL